MTDDLPSTKTPAEHFGREFEPSAFMKLIGLRIDEVSPTRVTGTVDVGPHLHQPTGIVHGGVWTAIVEESASYGAGYSVLGTGKSVVGVVNTTNFVRPISEGRVQVDAQPIHQGRTQQLWEVRIARDEDAKLVAIGQLRLAVIDPRGPEGAPPS